MNFIIFHLIAQEVSKSNHKIIGRKMKSKLLRVITSITRMRIQIKLLVLLRHSKQDRAFSNLILLLIHSITSNHLNKSSKMSNSYSSNNFQLNNRINYLLNKSQYNKTLFKAINNYSIISHSHNSKIGRTKNRKLRISSLIYHKAQTINRSIEIKIWFRIDHFYSRCNNNSHKINNLI